MGYGLCKRDSARGSAAALPRALSRCGLISAAGPAAVST